MIGGKAGSKAATVGDAIGRRRWDKKMCNKANKTETTPETLSAGVAQLEEQRIRNPMVVGSTPTTGPTKSWILETRIKALDDTTQTAHIELYGIDSSGAEHPIFESLIPYWMLKNSGVRGVGGK